MTTIERGDSVSSDMFRGVALWYLGRCVDECSTCDGSGNVEDEWYEDDQWFSVVVGCPDCHGPDCALVRMVGDDKVHHVDREMIESLGDEEFCGSCGQIGCTHG